MRKENVMESKIFVQLVVIAAGLSMDAFAVAICQGLKMKRIDKKQAVIISLSFGSFQAFMPLIGWLAAREFKDYIINVDHWIAFVLLTLIGGNMIKEGLSKEEDNHGEEDICCEEKLNRKQLFLMSVATSIDALAIGVTFAFLDYPIGPAISLIGCITFVLSYMGVCIGNYFGVKFKGKAEIAGGLILILMGTKILLEHLGVLVL